MTSPLDIQKEAENKILRVLEDMNLLEKNLLYRQLNRSDNLTMNGIDARIEKCAKELASRANSIALENIPVVADESIPNGKLVLDYTHDQLDSMQKAWENLSNKNHLHVPISRGPCYVCDEIVCQHCVDGHIEGSLHHKECRDSLVAHLVATKTSFGRIPYIVPEPCTVPVPYTTNYVSWTFSQELGGYVMTITNSGDCSITVPTGTAIQLK